MFVASFWPQIPSPNALLPAAFRETSWISLIGIFPPNEVTMDMKIQGYMKDKCMQAPGGSLDSQAAPHPSGGHEGGGLGRRKDKRKRSPEACL